MFFLLQVLHVALRVLLSALSGVLPLHDASFRSTSAVLVLQLWQYNPVGSKFSFVDLSTCATTCSRTSAGGDF